MKYTQSSVRRLLPLHLARFAILAGVLGIPRFALAQTESSESERLFDEGRAAMQSGDYSTACRKFAESNRLDPAVGTRFNLAHCEEEAGHLLPAWTLFRKVRAELPADDRRIPIADQHIAALARRLAHLRVIVDADVSGTRIRIDGVLADAPDATGALSIEPGKHEVGVSIPGRAQSTKVVEFGEGSKVELRYAGTRSTATEQGPDTVAVDRAPRSAPDGFESSEPSRTAAYVAGGVGAVALLVGTIAGVAGLHQESVGNTNCSDATRTCNQKGVDANRSAHSLATISTIGLVAGVIGVGVGGYLYFSATPPTRSASVPGASAAVSLAWGGQW